MTHANEIAKFIQNGDYEMTQEGLLIHRAILAKGTYIHTVNGQDEQIDHNLIPTEGINYLLNVALGSTAKEAAWYLALFSGAATPAANWTAATFTSLSTEITSTTEGYSGTTRPTWTPAAASAGVITNAATRAVYSIVTATSITVTGAGLLSAQTRGSTAGVLASASRFTTSRVLNNGDVFELTYQVSLTDS